jgi:hypothetical protein
VLNAITPPLQTEAAHINFELEVKAEEILAGLSLTSRRSVVKLIREVLKEVHGLETSIRGILSLHRILYAHHGGENGPDEIRKDMEKQLSQKNMCRISTRFCGQSLSRVSSTVIHKPHSFENK